MDRENACVFIDFSNLHYPLAKAGWQIDWERFKGYFEQRYTGVRFFYYEGVPSKGQHRDTHPGATVHEFAQAKKRKLQYFKYLRSIGFRVRHKPVSRVYDAMEGRYRHKCNFDVEITLDSVENLGSFRVFILCSGDGDFVKLVKYMKGKGKKTVVLAARERMSEQLSDAANQVLYLEALRENLERVVDKKEGPA